MTDISVMELNQQLRAAQDDLREQLLFQSSLLESIPVPIFYKDCQGRYQGCNRAFEEILGKSRAEIVGKSVFDMAPPEIADKYHAMDAELFLHPGTQVYEWVIQKPSGEIRDVLFHKSTFLRSDGAVGGLIGALVDITELKQKDVALEESEERLRATTETARDAFIVLEAEHGTITAWNLAATAIFGYAREEALGQALHDLLTPPRFREMARHGLAHFSASGEGAAVGKTLELVALRKDGMEFPVELSLSAMQIHGKWHATGIVRDISERKRAEAELHRSNRELRAISDCNQTLMRAVDEQALLNDICRIVCDEAGHRMAWVGYAENDEAKTIRPVAWAGVEEGYLAQSRLTWADTPRGRGPSGTAIRTGASACIQDFTTDPQAAPWRDAALQRGYRSSIALPLQDESGSVFGVLNIYSAESNTFTPDEIRLLNELSGDLAFGITALRARIERKRMEQERLAHLRFVESLDQINRAIQGANDLEQLMSDVLDAVLAIFDCDRAWLLYPCDPEAASWSVPMERTKPEYPGANVQGLVIPMDPEVERMFRIQRGTDSPVSWGPGCDCLYPEWLTEQFGVQSQLSVSTYPKTGKPWQFGMHQCAYARVWQPEEKRLFQEISRRLADGLTSLLSHRDLQESETRYRRIVDTSMEGIWGLGPDTLTTFVNSRMAELLGYSGEEMIVRPVTDFMFAEDVADHLRKMENRRQGRAESYERRYRRKDGQAVWALVSATPLFDDDHQFSGSFGMFSDITERKQAEEKLQMLNENLEQRVRDETAKNMAQERLMIQQSRLAAMGEMIHNIAHQWRQPINALTLLLANINDAYEFNELSREYLDREVKIGQRLIQGMSTTIDDFRNFFMPNKEKEHFLIGDAVENAIKFVSDSFATHNIKIIQETGIDPCGTTGYPNEFAQVVLNVLTNAKEALVGKSIAREIHVKIKKDENAVIVSIRDNGGGIPKTILPKIFDPYFTTKESGSGIGLYMSKMIMDKMGGTITIHNIEDGVEVLLTLPLADTAV